MSIETQTPFPFKIHELKADIYPFQFTLQGDKLFEFRKNDRQFHIGDFLLLKEYQKETNSYTGRIIFAQITYILLQGYNLPEGYCIMSIKILTSSPSASPSPSPSPVRGSGVPVPVRGRGEEK